MGNVGAIIQAQPCTGDTFAENDINNPAWCWVRKRAHGIKRSRSTAGELSAQSKNVLYFPGKRDCTEGLYVNALFALLSFYKCKMNHFESEREALKQQQFSKAHLSRSNSGIW